ncbi:hypothetical protein [Campylobacter coli]|uniref:hypothetical protein n=1 Tax=Campylobacter coli TaxID=195 RepID=UPI001CC5FA05|nr:hypothetical protein [Campylobacter coli]UAY62550.1 hypothetical protein LAE73_04540 [Campylobacter coli]
MNRINRVKMHNTMNIFLVISCEKDQQVIVYCLADASYAMLDLKNKENNHARI